MTRFAGCAVVAFSLLILTGLGCSSRAAVVATYPHSTSGTLGLSPHEHYQRISDLAAHDRTALIEDLDILFMTDRPGRLTRWHDK